MKIKGIIRKIGIHFSGVLLLAIGSASATVYVKDPVPIGTTGYSVAKITGQAPTTNAIIGCSGSWSGGTGVIYARPIALTYPANVNLISSGGSFVITNSTAGDTTGRATSRSISGSGLPTSGTLYFSTLIKADATALSKLANNQAYYLGVSRTDYNATDATVVSFPTTGVYIGFKKVSGVVTVSLGVNGTSYTVVPTAAAGTTYFCVVQIQLNAGDSGKEIVTAVVDPLAPVMSGTYMASTSAADVVSAGTTFTYLTVGGLYATGNGSVFLDEFLMTDSASDAFPMNLGDLAITSLPASSIGPFGVTANAGLGAVGASGATVYLDWGTAANALNTTINLGTFNTITNLSTVLSDLRPMATYYYRHRADDGTAVATSGVTIAFTTSGAASFSGLTSSNVLTTAYFSGLLAEPTVAATTVSLWSGSSPTDLLLVTTWDPVFVSTNFVWTVPDCPFGSTYFYAFKAQYEYDGDTYTFWSTTNSTVISADVIWTGAGTDTSWNTAANWDIGVVPLAVSTATINQGATLTATSDGTDKILQVNAATPVSLDFTGHTLVSPTVHVGTKTPSRFSMKGNFVVDTLFRIGDASASGSIVELQGGAALNVAALQVGYSSESNTVRILSGASVNATNEVLVLTSSGKCRNTIYVGTGGVFTAQAGIRVDDNINWVIIDGGVVTNKGDYYNGNRKSNTTGVGATLDIVNGGVLRQIGTLRVSPWYDSKVRVMNGGMLQAGAITIGTDADSGSGSRLIVSNATVTASSLGVPADDRHTSEGVMIYETLGRTTTVLISGGMNLGVYNSSRSGPNNRNNFLNLSGGTFTVGGAVTMGNTVIAAHSNNVIRISGKTAAFSAGSLIACNNSRLEFTIPSEGFDHIPVQVVGAASLDSTTAMTVNATAFTKGGTVTLVSAGTLSSPVPASNIVVTVKAGYSAQTIQTGTTISVLVAPSASVLIVR